MNSQITYENVEKESAYYISSEILAEMYLLYKLMSNRLHIFHPKDSCDNTFIRLINGGIF